MRLALRTLALLIAASLPLLALEACSDDPTTPDATTDGGGLDGSTKNDTGGGMDGNTSDSDVPEKDAATPDDGACPGPIVTTTNGETCTGFGTQGGTCDPSCGQPYGYICFEGAPPNIKGCREQRVSATLGNTYCCPKNECVERPDRTIDCAAVAGKKRHFQCPPLPGDAGNVTAPAGCVETNSGSSSVEKYYCCP